MHRSQFRADLGMTAPILTADKPPQKPASHGEGSMEKSTWHAVQGMFLRETRRNISIDLKSRRLIHSVPRIAKAKEHAKGALGVGPFPVPGVL